MKKITKYVKAPLEIEKALKEAIIIEDFLPKSEEIKLREQNVKITINLSQKSVESFKKESKKTGIPYQKMIKLVLDTYAQTKL